MPNNIIIRFGTEIEKQQLLSDYPNIKNVICEGGYFIVAVIEQTIVGYLWAFKRKIPAPVEQNARCIVSKFGEIFTFSLFTFHSSLFTKSVRGDFRQSYR